jgi:MmyB-like transcription regulator ligand binding domain
LAAALDIPQRQHNALLLAAGFAPEWPQRDLAAADLTEVASALDYILSRQEPYPAVVVDRHWNLLKSNEGAARLVEFLAGPVAPGTAVNLADALVASDVLRPYVVVQCTKPDKKGTPRRHISAPCAGAVRRESSRQSLRASDTSRRQTEPTVPSIPA